MIVNARNVLVVVCVVGGGEKEAMKVVRQDKRREEIGRSRRCFRPVASVTEPCGPEVER